MVTKRQVFPPHNFLLISLHIFIFCNPIPNAKWFKLKFFSLPNFTIKKGLSADNSPIIICIYLKLSSKPMSDSNNTYRSKHNNNTSNIIYTLYFFELQQISRQFIFKTFPPTQQIGLYKHHNKFYMQFFLRQKQ